MGIWTNILKRFRKRKQEEPDMVAKMETKIETEQAKSTITWEPEKINIKVENIQAEIIKAVTPAEENGRKSEEVYGKRKEMYNNWLKMHGKPMRRKWSKMVR